MEFTVPKGLAAFLEAASDMPLDSEGGDGLETAETFREHGGQGSQAFRAQLFPLACRPPQGRGNHAYGKGAENGAYRHQGLIIKHKHSGKT